jgi:hypothetical protein
MGYWSSSFLCIIYFFTLIQIYIFYIPMQLASVLRAASCARDERRRCSAGLRAHTRPCKANSHRFSCV